MKMTDAELDYCNAEGIPPAEYAKRKANRGRNSKRKTKRIFKDISIRIDEELAEMFEKHGTTTEDFENLKAQIKQWASDVDHMPKPWEKNSPAGQKLSINGKELDEKLAELINNPENSDEDMFKLGHKFGEWSRDLLEYLKQKKNHDR